VARALFRDTVLLRTPNASIVVPLSSSAAVYDVGTSNPVTDTLYADDSSTILLPNPIPIASDGGIVFWTLNERECDVVVTTPGYQPVRSTVVTKGATGFPPGYWWG
jgi:hypothetical protein